MTGENLVEGIKIGILHLWCSVENRCLIALWHTFKEGTLEVCCPVFLNAKQCESSWASGDIGKHITENTFIPFHFALKLSQLVTGRPQMGSSQADWLAEDEFGPSQRILQEGQLEPYSLTVTVHFVQLVWWSCRLLDSYIIPLLNAKAKQWLEMMKVQSFPTCCVDKSLQWPFLRLWHS